MNVAVSAIISATAENACASPLFQLINQCALLFSLQMVSGCILASRMVAPTHQPQHTQQHHSESLTTTTLGEALTLEEKASFHRMHQELYSSVRLPRDVNQVWLQAKKVCTRRSEHQEHTIRVFAPPANDRHRGAIISAQLLKVLSKNELNRLLESKIKRVQLSGLLNCSQTSKYLYYSLYYSVCIEISRTSF